MDQIAVNQLGIIHGAHLIVLRAKGKKNEVDVKRASNVSPLGGEPLIVYQIPEWLSTLFSYFHQLYLKMPCWGID
jgi:hypothetical protein